METEKKSFKSEAPEYTTTEQIDKIKQVTKLIERISNKNKDTSRIKEMEEILNEAYTGIYEIYGDLAKKYGE